MIAAKIDVTKIDKAHLFKGSKGTYLDLLIVPNKGGVDQFGNDGFIAQGVSKEAKEKGEKGPIIGNYRNIQKTTKSQIPVKEEKKDDKYNFDDVPF